MSSTSVFVYFIHAFTDAERIASFFLTKTNKNNKFKHKP
uniref:Uncharacterized protein n=1 Tax=viral metagenome TaxID=1070528 RepID=A0A6C0L022_9ZZZZ